jgi:hypothetical protein
MLPLAIISMLGAMYLGSVTLFSGDEPGNSLTSAGAVTSQPSLHFPKPSSVTVGGTHRYEFSSSGNETVASLEVPFAVVHGQPYVSSMRAVYRFPGRQLTSPPTNIEVQFFVPVSAGGSLGDNLALSLSIDDAQASIPMTKGTPTATHVVFTSQWPIARFLDLANSTRSGGKLGGAALVLARPALLAIREFASHMNPATPPQQ